MEDFIKHEIRQVPRTELKRQKNYMELLPLPREDDYQRLKEIIKREGLSPGHPILVNEDEVVLDGYTRLQIAEELGLEWVYVQTLEFEDHFAEKLFIISSNLNRRHLDTTQKVAAALTFKEIYTERARARQKRAGETNKSNLKQFVNDKDTKEDSHGHRLAVNSQQAGKEAGRAMEALARDFGVGTQALYRGQKIEQVAQTDPEIAESWEKAKQGEGSVNSVYQQVKEKEKEQETQTGEVKKRPKVVYAKIKSRKEELAYFHQKMKEEEEALNVPREELVETFRKVAIARNMPMDAVEALMESDPDFLEVWKHLRLDLVTPTICWCVVYWKIHVWLRARQGLEPDREFGRMIYQEMKKSACIFMMQYALKLLKYSGWPDTAVSLMSGVDRKLFPLMRAYEDRLDLLVDKIRLRPSCPPLFLEKARKLREKGKEDEARSVVTLGVITHLRNKWEKEDELERQRFGGPSNCLMKT
jgi:hypothetical protein